MYRISFPSRKKYFHVAKHFAYLSRSASNGQHEPILAIRREDNSVWERRAPLSPNHVFDLVKKGVKVLVQPSNRRAYSEQEYAKVGAIIKEDLDESPLIIGVKTPPVDLMMPEKTYVFFSHTIKAQESNMPLLDVILERDIRLIDYERMLDSRGFRVVAFGKYAGVSGMINILHGMGLRLLALGHHTPFMFIGPSHNYRNSSMARQAVRDAGYEISLGMMPKSIGPLTFVFTGSGNVSLGAQEVFRELPFEYVPAEHLPKVAKHGATNKLYACEVNMHDHLVHKEGGQFSEEEYIAHPDRYYSVFKSQIAPYASCIVNGIYWDPRQPRLISIPDAKNLIRPQSTPWIPESIGTPKLPHRLLAICDISADLGGSIEFVNKCTTIDHPFCLYDADENTNTESFAGPGVLMCSIDNMPAQIPRESTDFFGSLLFPYIGDMLKSDAKTPFEEYDASPVVKNAVIASNGKLTPNFEYIAKLREDFRSITKASLAGESGQRKVLILGAGYVSAPVVDYLSRDDSIAITVASQFKSEADALASKFERTTPVVLDIQHKQEDLEKMIQDHDLVISLLPYTLHVDIAKICIKMKRNMVTASYTSPQMRALNDGAKEAGISIVNEVGVDPGIDHMLAMECIDWVKENAGVVKSFISWCGGLPAPEFSDNPLRYRFSWSPRGVLFNTIAESRFIEDGEITEIPAGGALLNSTRPLKFLPGFNLEGFPNRDSLPYSERYGIKDAQSILRGTIRYKGFSNAMQGLIELGLIDPNPHPSLHPQGPDITWKQLVCEKLGKSSDMLVDSLRDSVFDKVGRVYSRQDTIEQLGLLDEEIIDKKGSPLDTLSHYLANKLPVGPGEKDIIIMRHDIGITWPTQKRETHHVDLVVYGDPQGYTAMAKTVGFPTGIAAKMILEGEIQTKGCLVPMSSDIYRPILRRLKQEGIEARSHITQH